MSFMMARKGVISLAVESTPVSMPSSREMYRTRCSGKYAPCSGRLENVVPAQSGEILGDDHIDLFGLDVRNHPLEAAGRS